MTHQKAAPRPRPALGLRLRRPVHMGYLEELRRSNVGARDHLLSGGPCHVSALIETEPRTRLCICSCEVRASSLGTYRELAIGWTMHERYT